jgi:predicted Zn-dependent peptidase
MSHARFFALTGALLLPSLALAEPMNTEWPLPSGLSILHRPDDRFPVVRVLVTVGAGTADTLPNQSPLAHLVEHVAFRADLAGGTAFQTLRAAGCQRNATTKLDTTSYQVECPKDAAGLAIAFATALATHDLPGIGEEDVALESRIVLAETLQRGDRGQAVMQQALRGVFTGDHPYHREERGPEDLLALRASDVSAFLQAHYVPKNTVIAVEGDIDAPTLAGLLARSAGDGFAHPNQRRGDVAEFPVDAIPIQWLATVAATWFRDPDQPGQAIGSLRPPARPPPPERPAPTPVQEVLHDQHNGTWPVIRVAWYLPPATRANWASLAYAGQFAEVTLDPVFRADGVLGGGCQVAVMRLGSALLCEARVEDEDNLAPIGKRIVQGFASEADYLLTQRLASTIADTNEQKWKARYGREWSVLEDLEEMSVYRIATGFFDLQPRLSAYLGSTGTQGWNTLRATWLGKDRAVTTFVEPQARAAALVEGTIAGGEVGAHPTPWPAPALGRVAATDAEERDLPNGLHTVVMPVPEAPFGAWTLVVPSLPGLDYLEPVVDEALRTPDTLDGNPIHYNWQASSIPGGSKLTKYQRGAWEPRHFVRSLWATVEGRKTRPLEVAFLREVRAEVYAGRGPGEWLGRLWRRATREDPERDGLPEIREALDTKGAVEAYLAAKYQPARSTLLLLGAVDAEARARIDAEMGDWKGVAATPPALPVARRRPPTPEAIVLDSAGMGRTVSVTWACPVAGAPDALTSALLAAVASDRLFDTVRASRGLTYTPATWTEARWGGVDLYLRASTELGHEAEVLAALRSVAAELGRGASPDALAAGRREVWSDDLLDSSSTFRLTSMLARGMLEGRSLAAIRARRDALANVDGPAIARLLEPCAKVGVAFAIGPAEEVSRGLQGGDLPVRVFDWRAEHVAFVQKWLPIVRAREVAWLARGKGG